MAKQNKNDSSIRNMLLKQGAVQPTNQHQVRDPKQSQLAAIAARRAEMNKR